MTTYKDVQQFGSKVSEIENRLNRYEQYIFHPRTHEKVLSCSNTPLKSFQTKKCCVAYHSQVNKQNSVTFANIEDLRTYIKNGTAKPINRYVGKPTSQFKTVWFSKGSRRQ
jgi:hypothetical protein